MLCNLKDSDQGAKVFGVGLAKTEAQYFERALARICSSRHGVALLLPTAGTGLYEKSAMLRTLTNSRASEVRDVIVCARVTVIVRLNTQMRARSL